MSKFIEILSYIFKTTGFFIYLALIALVLGITLIPCGIVTLIKNRREKKEKGVIVIE